MDLATDVYIPEDYVKSRYKRKASMQNEKKMLSPDEKNKLPGHVSLHDIKAVDEKKLLPQDKKNELPSSALKNMMCTSATSSHSGFGDCNNFKEDILFKFFTPCPKNCNRIFM